MSNGSDDQLARMVAEALSLADEQNLLDVGIHLHQAQLALTRAGDQELRDSSNRLWSLRDGSDAGH